MRKQWLVVGCLLVAALTPLGCDTGEWASDPAESESQALRAPLFEIVIRSPAAGATVSGAIMVTGTARGFKNVEVFAPDGSVLARVTPVRSRFDAPVDTGALAPGPITLTVRGWDSPAGTAFTRTDASELPLVIEGTAPPIPTGTPLPPPPPPPPASGTTASGVPLPAGFSLKSSDRFGSDGTVRNHAELHAKYYEAQFYNRNLDTGLVFAPDNHPEWYVTINGEQQTYVHFEQAIRFSTDHLTIEGRGHPDGSITSAEMVSKLELRSFCVESKYAIPASDKSWPAFWWYGANDKNDSSEIDFEQPITSTNGVLGVHHVSLFNHPDRYNQNVTIHDPRFSTSYMLFHDAAFDATQPHTYTACYDDVAKMQSRYIDGRPIYSAPFNWNDSLGGTGHGADACTILNLAVGGAWPGNLADPSAYSGDFDIYYVDYYAP